MTENFKSGFITIIGRPNAGKSTFINKVLGQKVSIISSKPQTTRNIIQGVYTQDDTQMIFIDTPGIHKPRHELGEVMNKESFSTLRDCDVIMYLVDANVDFGSGDEFVIKKLSEVKTPKFLVLNKIDLVKDKNRLMENVIKFQERLNSDETYYISSLNGDNIDKLLDGIKSYLPTGPMYYPKEQVSSHPEEFIISEIIREKILYKTNEEVPHSVAVVVEEMRPMDENKDALNIRANIYVERQSQKKIIIGKGGTMIKEIGSLARKDIIMLLGQKIYLELWVKVEEDWRNKKSTLRRMGYFLEN